MFIYTYYIHICALYHSHIHSHLSAQVRCAGFLPGRDAPYRMLRIRGGLFGDATPHSRCSTACSRDHAARVLARRRDGAIRAGGSRQDEAWCWLLRIYLVWMMKLRFHSRASIASIKAKHSFQKKKQFDFSYIWIIILVQRATSLDVVSSRFARWTEKYSHFIHILCLYA